MKTGILVTVGGVGLLAAGAAIFRASAGGTADPAKARPDPPAAAAPVPPPPTSPSANTALQLSTVLGEIRTYDDQRLREARKPASPEEAARVRSLHVQADSLIQELKDRLRADPASAGDVILLVASMDDLKVIRDIGPRVSEALPASAEPSLLDLLRSGTTPRARHAAVAFLERRAGQEIVRGLLAAAEEDPDSGVRLAAVTALYLRKQESPELAGTVDDLTRRRSGVEPDPNVRDRVAKMVPGNEPKPPPAPKSPFKGGYKLKPAAPPQAPESKP